MISADHFVVGVAVQLVFIASGVRGHKSAERLWPFGSDFFSEPLKVRRFQLQNGGVSSRLMH